MSDTEKFTLVFEGNIRKFEKNPLKTETEFGVPFAVGVGSAFEQEDFLNELIEEAIRLLDKGYVDEARETLLRQE